MGVRVTVLVVLATIHLGTTEESAGKKSYLNVIQKLYQAIGASDEELQLMILKSLAADYINSGIPLRLHKSIRDLQLEEWTSSGHFKALILLQSHDGVSFRILGGTLNMSNLRLSISLDELRDPTEYVSSLPTYKKNQSPSINNGSNGIPELIFYETNTACERNAVGDCERGTVVMDSWLNKTIAFQRRLDMDTPISGLQFLGTHNSFNNKADGYGTGDFTLGKILEALSGGRWDFVWAQQWFTITDQLNMGVRHLMLDPVYFWDAMRLCHCGTSFPWFDRVIDFIEKALNKTIDFNSTELGCMPYDRPFEAAIQEIHDWVTRPGNENEFVLVLVNDEGPHSDWDHIDLIQKPIVDIMGKLLFTPSNKTMYFGDSWPSTNQILQLGSRVMFTCSERCSDDVNIFADMTQPSWDLDTVKYFTPFPTCGGYKQEEWYIVGGESQVVGPIYNGPKEEGLVVSENFPYLLQCPVTCLQMDLASPDLMASAAWSWAPGYSEDSLSDSLCAAIDASSQGHWIALPCNTSLGYACVNATNAYHFAVSSSEGPWDMPVCPTGFAFGLPTNGYKNWILATEMFSRGASLSWINIAGTRA